MRASKAFYLLFSEHHNTSTAAEKCFLDILGVFADFETDLWRPQSLCWQGPSGLSPRPYSRGGYCISRGIAMPTSTKVPERGYSRRSDCRLVSGILISMEQRRVASQCFRVAF
jgi:hypothetical protein